MRSSIEIVFFFNQVLCLSFFKIKRCICPHSQSSVENDLLPNQVSRLSSFMIEWQDCRLLQTIVEIVLLLHQVNSDVSSYGDNNVSLSGDNDSE